VPYEVLFFKPKPVANSWYSVVRIGSYCLWAADVSSNLALQCGSKCYARPQVLTNICTGVAYFGRPTCCVVLLSWLWQHLAGQADSRHEQTDDELTALGCIALRNIFIARHHTDAQMVRYWYKMSVCPSVRPLRSGILWKWLNILSQFLQHTVAQLF